MADIQALLKTINADMRQAQNAIFSKNFDAARALLTRIRGDIEGAKKQDPQSAQLKSAEAQLAKLHKDLEARTVKATPPAAAGSPPAGGDKKEASLPAGVAKRLRDITSLLARKQVDDAASLLGEIDKQYGGQFDPGHPDYSTAKSRVAEAKATMVAAEKEKAGAAKAGDAKRDAMRQESEEWLDKMRSFAPHGSPLFGNRSQSVPELLEQKRTFDRALPVWEAYGRASFSSGKTDALLEVEKQLGQSFEKFPAFFEQMKQEALDRALQFLQSSREGLDRPLEGLPAILGDASLKEADDRIAQVLPLFAADNAKAKTLEASWTDLKKKNAANLAARAEKTAVREDRYRGEDASALKEKANRLALDAEPSAKILKTVVYREDWEEKSQWETQAGTERFVTRREIYAQVAAKGKDACRLFTIYLTKELRSDKTWSSLAGNVMFNELILEKNIR